MLLCVVEEGSYEDRRIVGIFTTKAKAEVAKELVASDQEILIFDTDTMPEPVSCPSGELPWEVYMNKTGGDRNARIVHRVSVIGFKETDITMDIPIDRIDHIFRTFAKDADHAVEIVDKLRALLIKAGKWRA